MAGCCVWLTGLSGAGKSTTADALHRQLVDRGARVVVFDGDAVRRDTPTGFSKPDRVRHLARVATLAAAAADDDQVVICALISPYRDARDVCRTIVGRSRFVEVQVATPLEVCERRDPKGLYGKARRGELPGFTGVGDPYEVPLHPDVTLDTVHCDVAANAAAIVAHLDQRVLLLSYAQS